MRSGSWELPQLPVDLLMVYERDLFKVLEVEIVFLQRM